MTELAPLPAGRFVTPPLMSESVVTDESWHHIAFVWEVSLRHLYMDGAEAAKDGSVLDSLAPSQGGLRTGAGGSPDAAGFRSGLIDDIRIYDQAVAP